MKIPLFEQTFIQFISSKSNWSGILAISLGSWLLTKGDIANSALLISYGTGVIGLKDAIVKMNTQAE